mmetsp:Transcript_726/g.1744  ORF Transcript_726/g.1744 Transcript_726/m.1744 type:complete len:550 (-) Transcript_726:2695-4344(-)
MRTPANKTAMALPNAADADVVSVAMTSVARTREKYDSPLTHKAVMIDLASWWCYTVLSGRNRRLPDEFGSILQFLAPIPSHSPLSIRLRCLVLWQDLLAQIDTPEDGTGRKRFEIILDRLILLRKDFFSESPNEDEYDEVLRMVQTHKILSEMFKRFGKISKIAKTGRRKRGDTNGHFTNAMLDQYNDAIKNIYIGSDDKIPASLVNLVNKYNGWDAEDRIDHITQIVTSQMSTLGYGRLKNKLQSLLLRWFEYEIEDTSCETGVAKIPELLAIRYRGIGFGSRSKDDKGKSPYHSDSVLRTGTGTGTVTTTTTTAVDSNESQKRSQRQQQHIPTETLTPASLERLQRTTTKDREEAPSPCHQQEHMSQGHPKPKPTRNARERETSDPPDRERKSDSSGNGDENKESRNRLHVRKRRLSVCSQPQPRTQGESEDDETSSSAKSPLPLPIGQARKRYRRDRGTNRSRPMTTPPEKKRPISSLSARANYTRDAGGTWSQEEDQALGSGVGRNGYGNWNAILRAEKKVLGAKCKGDLKDRADLLIARGMLNL